MAEESFHDASTLCKPMAENWKTVGSLYNLLEKLSLVLGTAHNHNHNDSENNNDDYYDSGYMDATSIEWIFHHYALTGELFQKLEDWEDLQRRLRTHGYSGDLTWLLHAMIPPRTEVPTTFARDTTPVMYTTVTGKTRNLLGCSNYQNLDKDLLDHHRRLKRFLRWRLRKKQAEHSTMQKNSTPPLP
jgi:hypothetical protein